MERSKEGIVEFINELLEACQEDKIYVEIDQEVYEWSSAGYPYVTAETNNAELINILDILRDCIDCNHLSKKEHKECVKILKGGKENE